MVSFIKRLDEKLQHDPVVVNSTKSFVARQQTHLIGAFRTVLWSFQKIQRRLSNLNVTYTFYENWRTFATSQMWSLWVLIVRELIRERNSFSSHCCLLLTPAFYISVMIFWHFMLPGFWIQIAPLHSNIKKIMLSMQNGLVRSSPISTPVLLLSCHAYRCISISGIFLSFLLSLSSMVSLFCLSLQYLPTTTTITITIFYMEKSPSEFPF